MTWHQAKELLAYWKEFPPVHVLVRGLVKEPGAAPATAAGQGDEWTDAKLEELMALFGQTGGQVTVATGG